ncbi:hypothetical protein Vretimale_8375 [Volvox reticuliferus]|uniref:Uncharacterized protein n=1 Tax=Volvox reticuliferus TaxID=1737510 RepID=A0A8J4CH27_9CHLO|nr:hypothetical protein Vretifemale_11768 [Volvox reticuliferus]GIM03708.1 hypothetical protein Vretimale_8375 [Volvox reticuliferus]
MTPPIRNGIAWGLGLANLDANFNALELEVRNYVVEVKGLEHGILSLEGELELALQQREHALNALASMNSERPAAVVKNTDVHIQHYSPTNGVITEPAGSLEQPLPTEEQHADQGQPIRRQNDNSHAVQRREGIDAAPNHPGHNDGPKNATAQVLHPVITPCSDAEKLNPSITLNADDIKKRLLQVLRHLRDTAAFCREIPDLDRGFSNMLKKTYKELYDSLKELTSKSAGSRPATDATAPNFALGCANAIRQATAQPTAETQVPTSTQRTPGPVAIGSASTGACAQPTSSRDLSALARLIHAKRLHQQTDGVAVRDPDQASVRRLGRATYASGNSRLPTLYDGLPPTRVAAGPSQGPPARPPGDQPARSGPAADADPNSRTQPQAKLCAEATDASTAETARLLLPARKCTNSESGYTILRQGVARECGPGRSIPCRVTESPAGGSGSVNDIGSPARQLLQHARTSGTGLALILLSQTAHPLGAVEPHPEGRSPLASSLQAGAKGHAATRSPAVPNWPSNTGLVDAQGGEPLRDGYCEVIHGAGAAAQTRGRVVACDNNAASASVGGNGLVTGRRIKRTIDLDGNAFLESMRSGRKRQHVGDAQLPQT